jgi:hypothetical protein
MPSGSRRQVSVSIVVVLVQLLAAQVYIVTVRVRMPRSAHSLGYMQSLQRPGSGSRQAMPSVSRPHGAESYSVVVTDSQRPPLHTPTTTERARRPISAHTET